MKTENPVLSKYYKKYISLPTPKVSREQYLRICQMCKNRGVTIESELERLIILESDIYFHRLHKPTRKVEDDG